MGRTKKKDGGNISSTKDKSAPKTGKKHPPPPQPRPPSPPPPKKSAPVNFECSTSEDEEDPSVRRAPPRLSSKKQREQRQYEMKKDKALLKDMKNPRASTSSPLRREQEKIKKRFPKKFPQFDEVPANSAPLLKPSFTSSAPNKKAEQKQNTTTKKRGETGRNEKRKRAAKENVQTGGRPVRTTRSAQDKHTISAVAVPKPEEKKKVEVRRSPKILRSTPASVKASEPNSAQSVDVKSKSSKVVTSKPTSSVKVLPNERKKSVKRQKTSRSPPLLFRISPSGGLRNYADDEEPPKLSPVFRSLRSTRHLGKENQINGSSSRNMLKHPAPLPQDSDQKKTTENGEPPRKKFVRARMASVGLRSSVKRSIDDQKEDNSKKKITKTLNLRSRASSDKT